MCDFSLNHVKSRSAVQADKLVTEDFARGTMGFKDQSDEHSGNEATAVCILPGTELAFEKPVELRWQHKLQAEHTTAIFRQKNKEHPSVHHDYLEFPNGEDIALTYLVAYQKATVLQLPAAPRDAAEAEEQRRAEFVG